MVFAMLPRTPLVVMSFPFLSTILHYECSLRAPSLRQSFKGFEFSSYFQFSIFVILKIDYTLETLYKLGHSEQDAHRSGAHVALATYSAYSSILQTAGRRMHIWSETDLSLLQVQLT